VDAEGFVDVQALETILRTHNSEARPGVARVRLVSVSGASNVLGTLNDLAEISQIVHRHGAQLLVDAAQLVAHRQVEVEACGIDYLAFSAHKAYAPFGTGVLVARKGLLRFDAAELQRIQASGEENVGGIAALAKALALLQRIGLDVVQEEEQRLTARALRGLAQIPGLKLYGIQDPDSPRFARKGGVIAFDLKGRLPSRVARELAERGGIGVRYGCHCAHLLIKRLLGVPAWAERLQGLIVRLLPRLELPGVVRVSLGIENTEADVDALLEALQEIAGPRRLRAGARGTGLKQRMKAFALVRSARVYAASGPTT
jgi:selenocysteine lyase/cysteine desulfurase